MFILISKLILYLKILFSYEFCDYRFLTIIYFMNQLKSVALLLFLTHTLALTCDNPITIVPDTFPGNIFNKTFGTINYASVFQEFISNPNMDSLRNYLMKQAPYIIPLWCLGGISFILLVAFRIEICCYNCCHTQYLSFNSENGKQNYFRNIQAFIRAMLDIYFYSLVSY